MVQKASLLDLMVFGLTPVFEHPPSPVLFPPDNMYSSVSLQFWVIRLHILLSLFVSTIFQVSIALDMGPPNGGLMVRF